MQFGCVFPTTEIGNDPAVIRDFVQTAEGLGYERLVVYDHVLGAEHADREPPLWGPYDETHPFHEPMVLLGYLAAITTRIELVVGVLISPQRQTALVAKQAAELAILSEGRFHLGLGTGWNHVEYDALGMDFAARGRMLDEQIDLCRRLWTGEVLTYEGDFHSIDRAACIPAPPESIPIWLGGGTPKPVRRAAEVGDGFIFASGGSRSQDNCRHLLELLDGNGRRDGFGIDVFVGFGDGPDTWDARIEAWDALGADTMSMRAMSASSALAGENDPGFTAPSQHIAALETFMTHVRG
ncbi:MAG: LLM class F420-dependent oxidoreductase [Actinomycetota bacterium]